METRKREERNGGKLVAAVAEQNERKGPRGGDSSSPFLGLVEKEEDRESERARERRLISGLIFFFDCFPSSTAPLTFCGENPRFP